MLPKSSISSFSNLVSGQMTVSEQGLVLNGIEQLFSLVAEQNLIIQSLRDEINHLKGESCKPTISAKNQSSISLEQRNVSSETARKTLGHPRNGLSIIVRLLIRLTRLIYRQTI